MGNQHFLVKYCRCSNVPCKWRLPLPVMIRHSVAVPAQNGSNGGWEGPLTWHVAVPAVRDRLQSGKCQFFVTRVGLESLTSLTQVQLETCGQ